MNVGGPDCSEKDHANMREVVTRHKQHTDDIGTSLQNAVKGVESNGSPGRQCMSLVVFVMQQMNVLVHPLVGMECTMHPVNANLHTGKVYHGKEQIGKHATHLVDSVDAHGIPLLHEPIREDRKHNV